ncbi:MAG: hypothetical protein QM737_05875 [Ferruginibacter sp.]
MNNYNVADWQSYYQNLQNSCSIPDSTCQVISKEKAVFRGMFLDLNKICDSLNASSDVPPRIEIYTDVLQVSDNLNWDIASSLFIFSRQVNVLKTPALIIDATKNLQANISIIANEINGTIPVDIKMFPVKNSVQYKIEQGNSAVGISVKHDYDNNNNLIQSTPQLLSIKPAAIGSFQYLSDNIQTYFTNHFIYATLLYDQNPELALSIFKWIQYCAEGNNQLNELFMRSVSASSLLGLQISASANNARFVPMLSKDIYVDEAKAFASGVEDYENKYLQLYSLTTLTTENIAAANTMLDNQKKDVDYISALLTQAEADYKSATNAADMAMANFKNQELNLKILSDEVTEVGLPAHKRDTIIATVFDVLVNVFSIGVALAEIAGGNEAAGAAAEKAGSNLLRTASGIETDDSDQESGSGSSQSSSSSNTSNASSNQLLGKIKASATAAFPVLEKLQKAAEILNTAWEISQEIIECVHSAGQKIDFTKSYLPIEEISQVDNGTWDEYKIKMDGILDSAIKLDVDYAAECKAALDILVIYGKAYTASKIESIKAGQHVAEINTRLSYEKAKQDNLKKLVNQLSEDQAVPLTLMHYFYQKYLDNKSYLFLALKNYQASYFYWALQSSGVNPKITDKANQISSAFDKISAITMDDKSALENFDPPPQLIGNILFSTSDDNVLADLKNKDKRNATIVIPPDALEFSGYGRVRINTIRVWLEGIAANATVQLKITNAGNYSDHLDGNNYDFVSQPLTRGFEYAVSNNADKYDRKFDNNTYAVIQMDGKIDKEVEYAYFEPTPFSHWNIEVVNYINLDLSNLNKISFYFEGSAIAENNNLS